MAALVILRRATEADIPFVMATERGEGFEALVGRWEERQHRTALRDGRHACFIAEVDGRPAGFALLRDWASPERTTLIKRVAVAKPGQGIGTALMRALVDRVFGETAIHRLTIGTFPDNLRARRVYERAGFVAEGVARGSAFFHGEYRDELVLAILRTDWLKARAADL